VRRAFSLSPVCRNTFSPYNFFFFFSISLFLSLCLLLAKPRLLVFLVGLVKVKLLLLQHGKLESDVASANFYKNKLVHKKGMCGNSLTQSIKLISCSDMSTEICFTSVVIMMAAERIPW
jgi:hypothetical protein